MKLSFDNRVAIVTGAGQGLGRSHALALAKKGARVMVNDLGQGGEPSSASLETVELIRQSGGEAFANGADVANYGQVEVMVAETLRRWGQLDIVVNNAGILRDRSFVKMTAEDFSSVVDIHLKGSFNVSHAAWASMREQKYGRIVMTTSSSGLFGNFGQANYSAAKMGLVGLMNTLAIEGENYGIRVNCILPIAKTIMTEGLMDEQVLDLFNPSDVSVGVLALCADEAPNRLILSAGAGCYSASLTHQTRSIFIPSAERTPEIVLASMSELASTEGMEPLTSSPEHTLRFAREAALAKGMDMSDIRWGKG
ncbi:MAG: SDR family NAD(P)-dependent oxidoreductase [Thiohalomonadaceae bacterium]